MVEYTAHNSTCKCSSHFSPKFYKLHNQILKNIKQYVWVMKSVNITSLNLVGVGLGGSSPSLDINKLLSGGIIQIGRILTLHVRGLGSIPSISKSLWSSIGWAERWRCLGCRFESHHEHLKLGILV